MNSRNPHQVSPPQRTPTTSVGAPTRRPTTEDWHRAASLLPDTPLTSNPNPPRQQPAPLDSDQRPPRSGLRLTRLGYWLAVIAITFLTFVLAGGLNPSQQTKIDGSTIQLFLVMYLPVAVLRARHMGFRWWSSVVITLVVLFVPFLILWLGIAKSTAGLQQWNLNKLFLVGITVFIAIMAVIVVVSITMVPQPSGANQPNPPNQPTSLYATPGFESSWILPRSHPSKTPTPPSRTSKPIVRTNAHQVHVEPSGERPRPSDHLGNIDVKFRITNTNLRGTAVTLPADGTPRWVYLAEKRQWYSSKLDDRSVLTTPPTASNQSAPTTTTARPNYTSLPPTTGAGSITALNCDHRLMQQFLASPLDYRGQ